MPRVYLEEPGDARNGQTVYHAPRCQRVMVIRKDTHTGGAPIVLVVGLTVGSVAYWAGLQDCALDVLTAKPEYPVKRVYPADAVYSERAKRFLSEPEIWPV